MSNVLEFILKMQDMLSPAIRQAVKVSDSSTGQLVRHFNKIKTAQNSVANSRFGTSMASQLDRPISKVKELNTELQKTKSIGSGGMIGGLLSSIGIGALAKGSLGMAAEREQQRISFGVMTGSQATGDNMLNDIVKMGAKTPFESGDLVRAAQTMKQFGIDNNKIMPSLKMLGDVAGSDANKLQSLSLAFSQVMSTGRLQGQDLLQLINAGFNPLLIISQQTGISLAELKKKMEAGAISADMVAMAFQQATGPGGQFYQMMEKQSQTLGGRWGTFMDTAKIKLLAFGEKIMPVASVVLDFLTGIFNNTPALIMLASGIGVVTVATGGWSVAQGILNFVMNMNPIIRIISLILILGGIIWSLVGKYEGWGDSMKGLWMIVKGFVEFNLIAWKSFGEEVWYWVQYAWLKVEGFVQWIGGAMNNVSNALRLAGDFKFGQAKDALFAKITTSASIELQQLERNHTAGRIKNAQAGFEALKSMQTGWNMVGLKKAFVKENNLIETIPNSGGGIPAASFGDLGGGGIKSRADGINSGGQKSIVVNVGKLIEKLEVHVMSAKEGAQEIENIAREAVLRAIYSLNSASPS